MGKFYEGLAEDLILRVRFAAWLHTAPHSEKDKAPRLTRIEQQRKDRKDPDYQPEVPEIDGGEQLLSWFWELMGDTALTHTELRAWQENTGFQLESWQARLLRRLSVEYLAEVVRAADPKCEPPWRPEDMALQRAAVAESMKQSMRAMAKL